MDEPVSVLIVDDEEGLRGLLERQLGHMGYRCASAENGRIALQVLHECDFDVAFVDLVMPEMNGMALLAAMAEEDVETVPVILSGRGTVSAAVDAMRHGAFDFVEKMPSAEALRSVVERAAAHRRSKRRARETSDTARQWETTFDAVPDLIAIVDNQHRFVRVNKAMATRLGCAPREAAGMTCHKCVHGTDRPPDFCPHTTSAAEGRVSAAEFYEKCLGGWLLVSVAPMYDADGRLTGSVHVARDVTEQKRAEEELRRAHREAETLLASMSSFLIEVDSELCVVRWNASAEKTFGAAAEAVVGKPFRDCGIDWDWSAMEEQLDKWLHTSEAIRFGETRYKRCDGSDGILGITVNPLKSGAGGPSGFVLLGADITDRKAMEAHLVQAQKLESIGQLAAGIAHEINTPTQYVGDNIEFLQYAFEDYEKLLGVYEDVLKAVKNGRADAASVNRAEAAIGEVNVEYLRQQIPRAIRQSREGVGRVAAIVLAMKEFSHPGAREKTRIDLNHAIQSTITVSRNEWKYVAEMETDFDEELPMVSCLPGEFNQVILNIIVNAAHAIAMVVGDGAEGKGKITVRTRQAGDWAEVRISDTGPGIPEEIRPRIFDPFFTTKEVGKGTGQGLAIARSVIAEKHGGTLTFETAMGKGTTFIIRLPIGGDTP